jgi:hypothetical protein
MIIFRGLRSRYDCVPNAMVKLSQREWMNTDLFLGWFTFCVNSIPPAHPVLIMD